LFSFGFFVNVVVDPPPTDYIGIAEETQTFLKKVGGGALTPPPMMVYCKWWWRDTTRRGIRNMPTQITTEDKALIRLVSPRRKRGMPWAKVAKDIRWSERAEALGLKSDWTGLYNRLHPRMHLTKDGDLVPNDD
jgi:hypothetical protein